MRRRKSYTLIEMLVVISMLTTLMLVTGSWLHHVLVRERPEIQGMWQLIQVSEFVERFRQDIHAAMVCSLEQDGKHLTCRLPADEEVHYRIVDRVKILRTTSGKFTSQNVYDLNVGPIVFHSNIIDNHQFIRMIVKQPYYQTRTSSQHSSSTSFAWEVIACVGRDHQSLIH